MRLSKILWFVDEAKDWDKVLIIDLQDTDKSQYFAITELMINIYCFYHSINDFVFLMNIFGKWSDLPLSRKSNHKKEKSMVSFMHHQHNIICSQTQLGDTVHEQTTICRQLFAGHVVASRPMKRKKNLHQMIINNIIIPPVHWIWVGYNYVISNKCKWNCFIKNAHKILRILPKFICKNNRFSYPQWLSQSEL